MADQDLKVWAETLTPDPLKGNNQRRDIEDEEWDEGWGRLSGVTAQQLNQLFYLVTGNLITAKEDIVTNTDNISKNTSDIAEIKEDIERVDILTVEMCITEIVPNTHTELDGKSFDKTLFPRLGAIFPSGVLPDMRGMILKHAPDGRSVLSFEAEEIKSLNHSATTVIGSTDLGTKTTSSEGRHRHRQNVNYGATGTAGDRTAGTTNNAPASSTEYTDYEEDHTHTVVMGSHNHSATTTVTSYGGSKNLVDNIAVKFIIKKV